MHNTSISAITELLSAYESTGAARFFCVDSLFNIFDLNEEDMTETTTEATTTKAPAAPSKPRPNYSRKTLKAIHRKKMAERLKDAAFAKAFFDAKSKRSTDKKSAFRKKKKNKK
ncbi:MAG: hypothetical protein A2583_01530 [Bdellovibrionales bacterium RIFOXYD1_FULL_53_11]|nr:MAG: hypothetical protein A2583_01530 [Bdellovibrionales bacterium RIFOXYD1_FULL_53_11]